jgi:hypothetical protein
LILDGVEGVDLDSTGGTIHNCVIYNHTNGVDVNAAGDIKNSIVWNNTDDLEETGANIVKTTNTIEDDGDPDPGFTSVVVGSYNFLPTTPSLSNGGTGVGLTLDILGNPIIGNPSIGAYQYSGQKKGFKLYIEYKEFDQ